MHVWRNILRIWTSQFLWLSDWVCILCDEHHRIVAIVTTNLIPGDMRNAAVIYICFDDSSFPSTASLYTFSLHQCSEHDWVHCPFFTIYRGRLIGSAIVVRLTHAVPVRYHYVIWKRSPRRHARGYLYFAKSFGSLSNATHWPQNAAFNWRLSKICTTMYEYNNGGRSPHQAQWPRLPRL